jgi:hypothetical protein
VRAKAMELFTFLVLPPPNQRDVSLRMQRLDSKLLISINKKINGFLRALASGMKNPGALPGFSLSSLLLLFYRMEHNYYANYFC